MSKVRKQNVFNTCGAAIKFSLFWLLVVLQLPIILLLPRGRASVHGNLSKHRPLMVVSNHISIFEIATFPVAFGGSFVAKKEMESWPLVGWVARKFGVIFVDRRPSHAKEALKLVQETVSNVKYPMFLFPEGTTTNGAYVKSFKSTLFNFIENSNVVVQPMAMHYRFRDGGIIICVF